MAALALMDALPISEEELGVTRSPQALFEWCENKFQEFGATEEGTTALRLSKSLCKPLTEEIYPLAIWAVNSGNVSEEAEITPVIGSQAYDASGTDARHEPNEYCVEVTQAHMGQSEYFRMLHLEEKGWAPGPLSNIQKSDLNGEKSLREGRIAETLNGHVDKTINLVCEAVIRKLKKQYKAPIVLLVAFEDLIVKNKPDIEQILHNAVTELWAKKRSPFSKVYLVGMLGHVLVEISNES